MWETGSRSGDRHREQESGARCESNLATGQELTTLFDRETPFIRMNPVAISGLVKKRQSPFIVSSSAGPS